MYQKGCIRIIKPPKNLPYSFIQFLFFPASSINQENVAAMMISIRIGCGHEVGVRGTSVMSVIAITKDIIDELLMFRGVSMICPRMSAKESYRVFSFFSHSPHDTRLSVNYSDITPKVNVRNDDIVIVDFCLGHHVDGVSTSLEEFIEHRRPGDPNWSLFPRNRCFIRFICIDRPDRNVIECECGPD